MNILVAGGAGFIGSHLCERLLKDGNYVICVDNLMTGQQSNVDRLSKYEKFQFINVHVMNFDSTMQVDQIYNLASPAAPAWYRAVPLSTLQINIEGAFRLLEFAALHGISVVQVSTIKVKEDYDHLNKDACYVEGKRAAETICSEYRRLGHDVKIARLYSTFGTQMSIHDPRVIPTFIAKALRNEDIIISGDGSQEDSFCYVDDIVDGLISLMNFKGDEYVFTFGNPKTITIAELAQTILQLTGSQSEISHSKFATFPTHRVQPNISLAESLLSWQPTVDVSDGLARTISYFREQIGS